MQDTEINTAATPAPIADAWIAIEERIPDPGVWVFVWANNQCHIGYVDPKYNHYLRWEPVTDYALPVPTHWQPLPPPPDIQAADRADVWTPVGERVPDTESWYAGYALVWTGSNYSIGCWFPPLGNADGWFGLYENETWGAPTHWTALPTPPANQSRSFRAYTSF